MSITIVYTIATLSVIGTSAAVILYFVAQKFKVYEDPRINEVEENLPAANCGGCGYAGCRAFAEACVKASDLGDLYCPVGGNETMNKVAEICTGCLYPLQRHLRAPAQNQYFRRRHYVCHCIIGLQRRNRLPVGLSGLWRLFRCL